MDVKQKKRQRIVVVGLGMVAISFIEKLLTLDADAKRYEVVVIGEESHLAYNRVGLTSFFDHRNVEELYLNPKEWVSILFLFPLVAYYVFLRLCG
jgi:nitrite reductase (NAD(P)H)